MSQFYLKFHKYKKGYEIEDGQYNHPYVSHLFFWVVDDMLIAHVTLHI
jgi:hypothetical protein